MGDAPKSPEALVKVLAPEGGAALESFLARSRPEAMPFSPDRLEAIANFSDRLLKHPALRGDPSAVAAAFWMRKANLVRFREAHLARTQRRTDLLWLPVGNVFHLAPSNVDTLFLYSWALAFLCGNANVVRVSQNVPATVEAVLGALGQAAQDHPLLEDQNRFVTYEHDQAVTALFSRWCHHRIVWGGDATVAEIRQVPLNPHASERCFASKFSFAVFKATAFLAAGAGQRARMATGFFNDLFGFDQAACSSPQILFWVGSPEDGAQACAQFLDGLQAEAERRAHDVDASKACKRLNRAFDLALRVDVRVDLSHPAFVAVAVPSVQDLDKEICGGGFLRTAVVPNAGAMLPFLNQRDQTVTHFGFDPTELQEMGLAFGARGVDRLVPIGEALNFDVVWDGFDLAEDCMRRVAIRS